MITNKIEIKLFFYTKFMKIDKIYYTFQSRLILLFSEFQSRNDRTRFDVTDRCSDLFQRFNNFFIRKNCLRRSAPMVFFKKNFESIIHYYVLQCTR